MITDSQERSLKQWHKALLRFTLPIVWVLILGCTAGTIVFLGPFCDIAAFISWVISGNTHADYTITPAIFPLALGFILIG